MKQFRKLRGWDSAGKFPIEFPAKLGQGLPLAPALPQLRNGINERADDAFQMKLERHRAGKVVRACPPVFGRQQGRLHKRQSRSGLKIQAMQIKRGVGRQRLKLRIAGFMDVMVEQF